MSTWPNVVQVGLSTIGSDPEATRRAYAATSMGSPEECGCTPCLNFAAQRLDIYPTAVLDLFEKLGIAYNREAEIYHMARLESGKHFYGGWFHFVGSILSGADGAKQIAENTWQPDLESQSEFFSLGFSARADLAREPLKGLSLVQFEFTVKIPWVIDAEEPK
jgi:hypothetical protein